MEATDRYPLGQQDFKTLRERGLVYIDKTDYVRKVVEDGTQNFFLTRPRRFGKSLLLSTNRTEDYIYVIELKYDGSAEEALKQIENKKYDRKFQMDGRRIIRIGANFSSDTRCIEDWKIQQP